MKKHLFVKLFISILVLIFSFFGAIYFGAEKISFSNMSKFSRIILFNLRLPRALLVLFTGLLLGGTGAVFQLFFRNPLAEPGIIGISSGATLGAVIASVAGMGSTLFISSVNLSAFAGAALSGIIITILAVGRNRHETTVMLLLCGTALATLYSSLSSLILFTHTKDLNGIYYWILGSFNGRGWKEFYLIIIPTLLCFLIMFFIFPSLDLLSGGEQSALALGVNVNKLRILVLACGSLGVSAAVCAGGTISFVGLIAPHIVRNMYGAKSKILIPCSMIFGAILLLIADTISRTIIAPSELPTGVITSLLGAPFFLSLCLKKNI